MDDSDDVREWRAYSPQGELGPVLRIADHLQPTDAAAIAACGGSCRGHEGL